MPAGRPTVMTEAVLAKLNEAFAIGASDKEACFYADISIHALYDYQQKHPEFTERKEALKERPVLLARQTVIKALDNDPQTARWFLERKSRHEFATKTEVEQSGDLHIKLNDLEDNQLDARLEAIIQRRQDSAA
jgi:hypothetical protein